MLNGSLRSLLLGGVSRAVFLATSMSEAWVRRVSLPLFLPAGVYVPGPRGDKLRAAMPAPPPVPVIWDNLPGFWASIRQAHVA